MTGNQEEEMEFQSTLPLRGVTRRLWFLWRKKKFQSTLPLRGVTAEMRHF